jgi:glycosyltransferase involved in cell wall biosynthesis
MHLGNTSGFDTTQPAVVIPAFDRPNSLRRLLSSVEVSLYPKKPRLIISVDRGGSLDVLDVARSFKSKRLDVEVRVQSEHLGLREHILRCADLSLEFGSVILLEDDLVVDPHFYRYSQKVILQYEHDPNVAQFALYSPVYNEYARLPFLPLRNGYSVYPMQVPCSRGQCWTSDQWKAFRAWYKARSSVDEALLARLPAPISRWPESSWKKYFAAYLVETNRTVIYPFDAVTTNCSDTPGTHVPMTSLYQTPMQLPWRPENNYRFPDTPMAELRYDAFLEPDSDYIYRSLGLERHEVEIDLYTMKLRGGIPSRAIMS